MRKRIFSIMDTKKKKVGIVVLCLILVGILGTGTALAVGGRTQAAPVLSNEAQTAPAVSSKPSSSQADTLEQIRTIAGKWAEAVKMRDGKAQYNLLSPKCQSAVYNDYSAEGWVTGVSSPWVESYEVSVGRNSATVTYRYATSTGFAGFYAQTLTFVEQNGKWYIDSFSEPKEIPAAGSSDVSYDPKVKAFLNSAGGSSFQQTGNAFVKALTLKLDPGDIGENAVSAEYEIALARSGGFDDLTSTGSFQKLSFTMEKVNKEWKVSSYKIEK